jgi:uncharacterized Zn finger protein
MHYEIQKVSVTDEFKKCPTCGYLDGFHSMLKQEKNEWLMLFICPSCHDVFDVGLTLPLQKKPL